MSAVGFREVCAIRIRSVSLCFCDQVGCHQFQMYSRDNKLRNGSLTLAVSHWAVIAFHGFTRQETEMTESSLDQNCWINPPHSVWWEWSWIILWDAWIWFLIEKFKGCRLREMEQGTDVNLLKHCSESLVAYLNIFTSWLYENDTFYTPTGRW